MFARYGLFTPNEHRKLVVSTVLKRYPNYKDALSKQLKYSEQAEKIMYDPEAGAVNVVDDILQKRLVHETSSPEEVEPSTAALDQLSVVERVSEWIGNFPSTPPTPPTEASVISEPSAGGHDSAVGTPALFTSVSQVRRANGHGR